MKVMLVSVGLILLGFLGVSKLLTGNFLHYCGLHSDGQVLSCQTGFMCMSRSAELDAPGKCVFATDALSWWDINFGKTPLDDLRSDTDLLSDLQAIDSCEVLEQDIKTEIESLNYCETASDCIVKSLGCPFDCHALLNQQLEDRVDLLDQIHSGKSCPSCVYKCPDAPENIDCVDNKCIEAIEKKSLLIR